MMMGRLDQPTRNNSIKILFLCILAQYCDGLPRESCRFSVAIIPASYSFVCFETMMGPHSVCGSNLSNSICNTNNENNLTCIKWPSNINLGCRNDTLDDILKGNIKCASDQESISCSREFPRDNKTQTISNNSASSLALDVLLIPVCVTVIFLL